MPAGGHRAAGEPPEGRRLMPRSTAKIKRFTVKLTPDQHRAIATRAERCGMRPGVWMRAILVQAALRQPSDGRLLLKEPDGAFS